MNSRIARKDIRKKSTIDPMPPVPIATPKIATMIHQARMRAFRLATVARPLSPVTFAERIPPITLAMISSSRTPTTSLPSIERLRINPSRLKSMSASQCEQRLARSAEERRLVFVGLHLHRCADDDTPDQRHRKYFALRKASVRSEEHT